MTSFTFEKLYNRTIKLVVVIVLVLFLSTCSGVIQGFKSAFPVSGTENQKKIIAEEFWAQFFDETETQVAINDEPIESTPLDSVNSSSNLETELNSGQQEQISTANLQTNDSQNTQLALACPENSTDLNCVPNSQISSSSQTGPINQTQLSETQTSNNDLVYAEGEVPLNTENSTNQPLIITEDSDNFDIVTSETNTSLENEASLLTDTAVAKPENIPESDNSNQIQTSDTESVESTVDQVSPEENEINLAKTDASQIETDNSKNVTVQNQEPTRLFRWPATGRVIAEFGPNPDGKHNDGINLAVPEGTPVKAAEDGLVIYSDSELEELGNLILVRHSGGWVSVYAHIKEAKVDRGDTVKRGDEIAYAGATGPVDYPQLHFELRSPKNIPVNPLDYLPKQ